MMAKSRRANALQSDLFKPLLRDIICLDHELVLVANDIDWQSFADGLAECFCEDNGRLSALIRLLVGLIYLKFWRGINDEAALASWGENSYWQYFTGETFFRHDCPVDQSTLSR